MTSVSDLETVPVTNDESITNISAIEEKATSDHSDSETKDSSPSIAEVTSTSDKGMLDESRSQDEPAPSPAGPKKKMMGPKSKLSTPKSAKPPSPSSPEEETEPKAVCDTSLVTSTTDSPPSSKPTENGSSSASPEPEIKKKKLGPKSKKPKTDTDDSVNVSVSEENASKQLGSNTSDTSVVPKSDSNEKVEPDAENSLSVTLNGTEALVETETSGEVAKESGKSVKAGPASKTKAGPASKTAKPGPASKQPKAQSDETKLDQISEKNESQSTSDKPNSNSEDPKTTESNFEESKAELESSKPKPGPASKVAKPGPASKTSKPGPASKTSKPGPASKTSKSETADEVSKSDSHSKTITSDKTGETSKPGPASKTSKPGPASKTSKPGPASKKPPSTEEATTPDKKSKPGPKSKTSKDDSSPKSDKPSPSKAKPGPKSKKPSLPDSENKEDSTKKSKKRKRSPERDNDSSKHKKSKKSKKAVSAEFIGDDDRPDMSTLPSDATEQPVKKKKKRRNYSHVEFVPRPDGDYPHLREDSTEFEKNYVMPDGWVKKTIQRRNGSSIGSWDAYLFPPPEYRYKRLRSGLELIKFMIEHPNCPVDVSCVNMEKNPERIMNAALPPSVSTLKLKEFYDRISNGESVNLEDYENSVVKGAAKKKLNKSLGEGGTVEKKKKKVKLPVSDPFIDDSLVERKKKKKEKISPDKHKHRDKDKPRDKIKIKPKKSGSSSFEMEMELQPFDFNQEIKLEKYLHENPVKPSKDQIKRFAKEIDLNYRAVKKWFKIKYEAKKRYEEKNKKSQHLSDDGGDIFDEIETSKRHVEGFDIVDVNNAKDGCNNPDIEIENGEEDATVEPNIITPDVDDDNIEFMITEDDLL